MPMACPLNGIIIKPDTSSIQCSHLHNIMCDSIIFIVTFDKTIQMLKSPLVLDATSNFRNYLRTFGTASFCSAGSPGFKTPLRALNRNNPKGRAKSAILTATLPL